MNSSPARSRSSSLGMEKETIIMNKEMENKYKISLSHLRRKYSQASLEQLLRVFEAYDINFSGYITKDVFPRLCEDLDVKPWKAAKEIDIKNGRIYFEDFVNWWFTKSIEHNKQEDKYVLHILDNYEKDNSGYISPGNLVELAKDLGIKPWHIFKELEVDPKNGVKKEKILKWWFEQDISKDNDQGHLMFIEELKPVEVINKKLIKIQGEIAEISVLLQMINPSEPDIKNN